MKGLEGCGSRPRCGEIPLNRREGGALVLRREARGALRSFLSNAALRCGVTERARSVTRGGEGPPGEGLDIRFQPSESGDRLCVHTRGTGLATEEESSTPWGPAPWWTSCFARSETKACPKTWGLSQEPRGRTVQASCWD